MSVVNECSGKEGFRKKTVVTHEMNWVDDQDSASVIANEAQEKLNPITSTFHQFSLA